MNKATFDQYVGDGWHLFELYKTSDGKGNAVKGMYATPSGWNNLDNPQPKFSPKAIYGGVPPIDIVVIDWDVKGGAKNGDKSFERLQKDLGVTLENTVVTPSGGGHCYVRLKNMPEDTPKLKKSQLAYPDIDFQSHGSEFVVLGEQEIDGYGAYEFTDEDFGYFVNDAVDFSSLELRKIREAGEGYDNIDEFEHISKRPSIDEVRAMLDTLSPDMSHDEGWQNVIMALNSWDLNGEVGLELAIEWSQKSTLYNATAEEIAEKYYANVADAPEFYNKLFSLTNKSYETNFKSRLETLKTEEDFEKLAEDISISTVTNKLRNELADEIAVKEKELGLSDRKNKTKWAKKLKKHIESEHVEITDTKLYLCNGKYVIQYKEKVVEDIGTQMVGKYLNSFGFTKAQIETMQANVTAIENVRQIPDYNLLEPVGFFIEENGGTKLPSFVIRNNPLINITDYEEDDEILNDFLEDIWNGKAEDIVRLIALTIKTGEQKLNRLMIVAPSNTGKSEVFSHLNFQKITMKRLLNGMRGDKGIGSQVVDGIRKSGLLLIDEANKPLEAEIKDMDKELHIDQFASGGTQIIPLHFTALTSTHKTATRNNSDELYNRFLQVELTSQEVKHTIMNSEIFLRDTDKYTRVVRSYLLYLFRNTLIGDEGKAELKELQEKYRLPTNNDLDTLLYDISIAVIENTKAVAKEHGDIIVKNDEYFYKRKGDLSGFIVDKLTEANANLDIGKYEELLVGHLLSAERSSHKINGVVGKYYKFNAVPYAADEEQMVLSMFDDLEIQEL